MIQEKIFDFFTSFGFSPKAVILFLGALPVTELRASIPIGILVLKQTVKATFFFSVLGNILPIAPIYFLLNPISKKLSKTRFMRGFFEWLFKRAKAHAGIVEKYETIGLMLFVAVPLPGTGAWTGAIVASLLRMRFIPAFIAVTFGVIIAAIIVTALTLLGKNTLM
ncbi:MAG: small multi-drug export protein [Candidatus Omnitrophota bacterium]|nr:small multi-drug export protein [Candidatus Omnitrophota bacterium]